MRFDEIAASAQEQSTGLAQVNTAVNQMDQVTQQNAAMVEQSTAASHALVREAQALNDRLGAASDPSVASCELLTFQIGEQAFCLNIMSVREIRGWTKTTALPHSPAYVRGVVNLRGAVLPLVDLSSRLGFASTDPTERSVIIVAQIGAQTVGLLVDAVCDIITVAAAEIQPTPNVASRSVETFVQGILAIENRMISLIGLDDVLPAIELEAA